MRMTTEEYKRLYLEGNIARWYLRDSQLKLYEMLLTKRKVVTNCHRRWGKGTTVFAYVFERCLTEKIVVRYGTDTQLHANSIFEYLRDKIFDKCPSLKPQRHGNYFLFKNTGSRLYIFGVKDSSECDKARGEESDIIVLDEYGFWKFKPAYMLKSVLQPQLLETNGQMIITSTPPEDLTHEYVNQVAQADKEGNLFKWNIYDTLDIKEKTLKDIENIIQDCGGIESDAFKREYKCELIATKERLVIPEAQNEDLFIVDSYNRPAHYDYYVCMDLGLRDFTAVLFGYYDFKAALFVVEYEYVTNYTSTANIVIECNRIETLLNVKDRVYRRIGDCEMQQLFDMSKDHGYEVSPITKRSKQSNQGFRDSVINALRMAVASGSVKIVKDGCPSLIQQLKYGIWNEHRTDFERSEVMGHLDALIAMAYLWDNVNFSKNPYPHKWQGKNEYDNYISEQLKKELTNKNNLGKMFGR